MFFSLNNMKIGYVVLHYSVYEMTIKCVDALLNISSVNSEIIIVDNNSPNNSGDLLMSKYCGNHNVSVIKVSSNIGFAKGNNVGYITAKEKGCNLIVVMNNDVVILEENFEKILHQVIINDNVGVLCPDIINLENQHQNPFRLYRLSTLSILKDLLKQIILYFRFYLSSEKVANSYTFQKRKRVNLRPYSNYGIIPHGAAVIYTQNFINMSDVAFLPVTFFYGEEDLLYDYLLKLNLTTYYAKELTVYHHEKVATHSISKGTKKRCLFQTKNRIKSNYVTILYRIKNLCL